MRRYSVGARLNDVKRLECNICGKKFWTVAQLENHLIKKHGQKKG